MVTFDIYSLGDGAYLAAVLEAVARLTGTGDFSHLVGLGFLFGTLLVVLGGLMQGKGPQFQHILIAWVIYVAMFGPNARAAVEDLHTGTVRTVDNVPLGVVFVGSAMSHIGYGITRLFEQAFTTPRVTEGGFVQPLQALQNLRRATLSLTGLGAANSPTAGADMERSLVNYFNECVLYAVDIKARSRDEILRNPDWTLAFASNLRALTTELSLGGPPQLLECPDAWAQLQPYIQANFLPALTNAVAAGLLDAPANVLGNIQGALDALAGPGIDAQDYMLMEAFIPMLVKADAARARERMDYATAASIMQATQQRNTQWAGEATLFEDIMRPMMTFFEAFLFAVSPLMAFAIALGPMGIRMVGKWLLFGLWVQLWQPVLAVLNLYVIMALRGAFDAMQAASIGDLVLPSVQALWQADLLLSKYLATAGMLMASTPAISLMLIYGSAVTATHLAGRLQSGDHFNEKQLSPDVSAPAPALQLGPLKTNAPTTGTITTNAQSLFWSVDVGREASQQIASSASAMQQASMRFSDSQSNALQMSARETNQTTTDRMLGWNYREDQSQTGTFMREQAEQLSSSLNLGNVSKNDLAGMLQLATSAGSNEKAAVTGKISSRLQTQYGITESLANEKAQQIMGAVKESAQFQSGYQQALAMDHKTGRSNALVEDQSTTQAAQLSKDATDALQATKTYEQVQSTSMRAAAMGRYGAVEIGRGLTTAANGAELMRYGEQVIDNLGLTGDYQHFASHPMYTSHMNPDAARAAAMIGVLGGYNPTTRTLNPAEQGYARASMLNIMSQVFGSPGMNINPDANAGLRGAAPGFGAASGAWERGGYVDPRGVVPDLRGRAGAAAAGFERRWGGAPAAMGDFAAQQDYQRQLAHWEAQTAQR